MFLCWKRILRQGWLWVCVLCWLAVTEAFPDCASSLVLLTAHGSWVPSPAMEQMALAPFLVHTPGFPFLSKKTELNVALSAWVACGSLHSRIVNYVLHPESPEKVPV